MLKLVGPENSQGAVSAEADALFKQYIIMEAAGIDGGKPGGEGGAFGGRSDLCGVG
jgi:hypothetical protein